MRSSSLKLARARCSLPHMLFGIGVCVLIGGPVCAGITTHTYDAAGRLVGSDYGNGKVITYEYDKNGNLLNRTVVVGATDADVRITKATPTVSITSGVDFTYTLTVTNDGPDPATGVTVSDELPLGLAVSSFSVSQGSCTLTGRNLACDLGVLGVGASAVVEMKVFHAVEGLWTNEASASADQNDPDPADNSSSDSSTGTAANDSDGDGIPNWWEIKFGLSFTSSSGQNGANGDPDGDGYTNLEEWLADTDPRNSESFPRVDGASEHPGGGVLISIITSPNRIYTLEYTPDLVTPYVPIETKEGTGGVLTFHDPAPVSGRGFYQVAVEIPTP